MSGSWGQILANPNTNAAGLPITAGTPFDCPGGKLCFAAVASAWNAATAALQMQLPDGATWIGVGAAGSGAGAAFTANGYLIVDLPPCQIQLAVSGGTPTALYATIARVVA
jgi:hypothetical protein